MKGFYMLLAVVLLAYPASCDTELPDGKLGRPVLNSAQGEDKQGQQGKPRNVQTAVVHEERVPAEDQEGRTEIDASRDHAVLQPIEAYAAEQDGIWIEFQKTDVEAHRDRDAYILSELWKAGLLKNEIKDDLVERHYSLVLLQVYGNYQAPNFVVRCYQTFPFPSVWTDFTSTLMINGEVVRAPDGPQKEHAMSVNSSTITSRIGGVVRNGDVIQYQVRIREKQEGGTPWQMTIWTNKVVAQGLKQ